MIETIPDQQLGDALLPHHPHLDVELRGWDWDTAVREVADGVVPESAELAPIVEPA